VAYIQCLRIYLRIAMEVGKSNSAVKGRAACRAEATHQIDRAETDKSFIPCGLRSSNISLRHFFSSFGPNSPSLVQIEG